MIACNECPDQGTWCDGTRRVSCESSGGHFTVPHNVRHVLHDCAPELACIEDGNRSFCGFADLACSQAEHPAAFCARGARVRCPPVGKAEVLQVCAPNGWGSSELCVEVDAGSICTPSAAPCPPRRRQDELLTCVEGSLSDCQDGHWRALGPCTDSGVLEVPCDPVSLPGCERDR